MTVRNKHDGFAETCEEYSLQQRFKRSELQGQTL